MLSRRKWTLGFLLVLAVLLAGGNVWFAAARSTIPLALDAVVVDKEVRHEKHPPRDDVWLIRLDQRGVIQVDRAVFERVEVGDWIRKERWSRVLDRGGERIELEWSADARGMIWGMPVCLVVMGAVVWVVGCGLQANDRKMGDRKMEGRTTADGADERG